MAKTKLRFRISQRSVAIEVDASSSRATSHVECLELTPGTYSLCMAAKDAPLDTTIAVVTPENIAFEYQLAGPFRRLPAYLIDVVVRWGIILGLLMLLGLIGGMVGFYSPIGGSFTMAIWVVVMFLVTWFYGTTMEAYFNGRTVGKWSCGIRVIDVDGRPVSGRSALLRNLLRVADMAPVAAMDQFMDDAPPMFLITTGMIGLLTMVFTRRLQRLGDMVAGTMVIVDERSWRLPVAKVDDPRVPALSSFVPGDYRVSRSMAKTLAIYAERRHYLTPPRRREIARHLTDPLIDRFEFRPDIDPDLLLYALYYKTFLEESSAEEPDLGSLRGYSPLARDMNKPTSSTLETSGQSPLSSLSDSSSTPGHNDTSNSNDILPAPASEQTVVKEPLPAPQLPNPPPLSGSPPLPNESSEGPS